MESPKTLQAAIKTFSDYDNCRKFMAFLRWPDGKVKCPTCQSEKVGYLEKARVYVCYEGHKKAKFSLKVGTVFEDSPIGLEKWLPCVWLLVNAKNGVSSWEIHRALGVTQKTAWFMLHRVRAALKSGGFEGKFGGPDSGPIEIDETFVGGAKRFMHASKKQRFAAGARVDNKVAVIGFLDRDLRRVRTKIIPNVKRETLQSEILNNVEHGSQVYTDNANAYDNIMRERFIHDVVNKAETYVRGQVHVNTLENFWSCAKRALKGTYIAVEPFHLERYLDEQIFRFENRATRDNPLNDSDRFVYALSKIVGKRLSYAELTGKEEEAPF